MTLYLNTDTTDESLTQSNNTAPRISTYLYSVVNAQYDEPIAQTLAWGYSDREVNPELPETLHIPSWMTPDYPFVEPSEDVKELITDVLFSFENPKEDIVTPIWLKRITKHDEGLYSVCLTDANNNVIFDSANYEYTNSIQVNGTTYIDKRTNNTGKCVYKQYDWGKYREREETQGAVTENIFYRYDLLYWETELITLKMVIRKNKLRMFSLYPDSAELEARAIYQFPKRVRSIQVADSVITGGKVKLTAGYNMSLSTDTESNIRTANTITCSAIMGAGKGIETKTCTGEDAFPLVTSINGVKPNKDGDFYLTGDDCHTIGFTGSFVSLANACTPCCTCEDMSDTGKLLKAIEDEYYCLGGKYKVLAQRYIEQVTQLQERVDMEAEELPSIEYDVLEGNRLFASFRLVFRNMLPFCIKQLRIKVHKEHMAVVHNQTRQSGPVAKDYSDCYEIDELLNISISEDDDYFIVYWDKPIMPGQQVYLIGLYRLNTHYQEYDSWVEDIKYMHDCENDVNLSVDLTKTYHKLGYGPWDHMQFDDFTNRLTGSELDYLEKEIRQRCLEDGVDKVYRRNTNGSTDI